MDYKETLEYLYRQLPMFSRVGQAAYKPGLQTSERLDEFFGHPHRKFVSIHVGGTNGKGSTSHLIAAVLQAQGYKVGLYTSPHLVDFRERIRVNGEMIPEKEVVDFTERYQSSGYEGHPSFFELTMMMAFDYFARSEVDYAVIEVGMGGRLDSTNIITPILSVITNISKDHTQFLGDTLEKIAGEKAGIIKPGIPVVIGEAEDEVLEVFLEKAQDEDAPLSLAFMQPESKRECALKGDYQRANTRTVEEAIRQLRLLGVEISEDSVDAGFRDVCRTTGLQGRWMQLSETPPAFCDTGHNEAGLGYVLPQIRKEMQARGLEGRLRMVVGFVADKAIDDILSLMPQDAEYYFTQAAIPRALPADQLAMKAADHSLCGNTFPSVAKAYAAALSDARPGDFVFVGGSTFVVADLLASR